MFGARTRTVDETRRVRKAADDAQFSNLGHAAARIRKDMAASVERAPGASDVGQPIHTHRGSIARRAIRFAVDDESAVIGFRHSMVGESIAAHEHGERYKGTMFPQRPTAAPALDKNLDRFAADWAGTIGE